MVGLEGAELLNNWNNGLENVDIIITVTILKDVVLKNCKSLISSTRTLTG